MDKPLRVLNVEDSERDVALLRRHLSTAGYDVITERTDTAEGMRRALDAREWDIILCDYSMPNFSALAALVTLRESRRDIPLIIISGTVGEEIAVEAMRAGANDYLPKDNLTRLIPAIERELQESKNRRKQRETDNERRIIFEIIQGVVSTPNLDEFLKLVHRSISQILYAENCFVMLYDAANDLMDFKFWVDKRDPIPQPQPLARGFASYVLRTGQPLLITEEKRKALMESGEAEQVGTFSPSWLGVPLRTPSGTIGVLVLQHYEDKYAYHQRDLEFLSSIGDQIALAIERKRAEEALGESEERYRDLVENAMDIIYTHDLEGRYTSANKAAERVTGYTQEEILKTNLADTVAPEYFEKVKRMIDEKLAGGSATAYEVDIVAKDGHRIAVEINTRIIYEKGVAVGVQGIARDITERKQLEGQFLQSQKMEAIGLLAGGIAHDFNNLLTAINGYSDLTLRKLLPDDPLRVNIKEIKNAGERAAALTSQLLAFSRKQVLKPRVHNLNTVITEIERMLRRIIKESIEFQTVLFPDLGNIKADPGQIEQVIMNLAVNARDAMPEGGRLTIETENVYLDGEFINRQINLSPGAYVRMSVTDTGQGMDNETQRRIFEPFFTTKEVGKGSGLGLSTVHGIIKQSGGDIMVYSEVGHGTTFKVYLPCVDESVQRPKWAEDADEDLSGTETILLVEDDDIVRNLVREILKGNGYNVLEAAAGERALNICETHPAGIDLLLTDMIMPGMSGVELKEKVAASRPQIKLLFMSGYTDDSLTIDGVLDGDSAFIEKPFTPDTLARKIREVLKA